MKSALRFHQEAVREPTACTARLAPVWRPAPFHHPLLPARSLSVLHTHTLSPSRSKISETNGTPWLKRQLPGYRARVSLRFFFPLSLSSPSLLLSHPLSAPREGNVHLRKVNIGRTEKLIYSSSDGGARFRESNKTDARRLKVSPAPPIEIQEKRLCLHRSVLVK